MKKTYTVLFAICLMATLAISASASTETVECGPATLTVIVVNDDGSQSNLGTVETVLTRGYNVAPLRALTALLGGDIISYGDGYQIVTTATGTPVVHRIDILEPQTREVVFNNTTIYGTTGAQLAFGEPGLVFFVQESANAAGVRDICAALGYNALTYEKVGAHTTFWISESGALRTEDHFFYIDLLGVEMVDVRTGQLGLNKNGNHLVVTVPNYMDVVVNGVHVKEVKTGYQFDSLPLNLVDGTYRYSGSEREITVPAELIAHCDPDNTQVLSGPYNDMGTFLEIGGGAVIRTSSATFFVKVPGYAGPLTEASIAIYSGVGGSAPNPDGSIALTQSARFISGSTSGTQFFWDPIVDQYRYKAASDITFTLSGGVMFCDPNLVAPVAGSESLCADDGNGGLRVEAGATIHVEEEALLVYYPMPTPGPTFELVEVIN